jgi:hypothetical protein
MCPEAQGSTVPNVVPSVQLTVGGAGIPGSKSRWSRYPGSLAQFAVGDNPVQIPWDLLQGTTMITIPDPNSTQVSLEGDLTLFPATNSTMLLTTRAYLLATFPGTLSQE